MKTHNYRELNAWKKSRLLVKKIYQLTAHFPNDEKFGLSSQMRRAAVSIPSNIAEGSGRGTNKSFANFISIAIGSAYELETQLWLSIDLEFISEKESNQIINDICEIQKMLFNFRKILSD